MSERDVSRKLMMTCQKRRKDGKGKKRSKKNKTVENKMRKRITKQNSQAG